MNISGIPAVQRLVEGLGFSEHLSHADCSGDIPVCQGSIKDQGIPERTGKIFDFRADCNVHRFKIPEPFKGAGQRGYLRGENNPEADIFQRSPAVGFPERIPGQPFIFVVIISIKIFVVIIERTFTRGFTSPCLLAFLQRIAFDKFFRLNDGTAFVVRFIPGNRLFKREGAAGKFIVDSQGFQTVCNNVRYELVSDVLRGIQHRIQFILIHDERKYGTGCSDYARNDGGIYKLFPEGSVPGVFASAGSSANTAVFGISGYFFAAFLASHGSHSNDG